MVKIVSVLHFPAFSGPHNQSYRLAGPFAEKAVQSLAVLPEGAGADRLRLAGVTVDTVNLQRVRLVRDVGTHFRWAVRFPVDVWNLIRVFRRRKPDVVQLTSLVNLQGAIAARLLGIPVVWQLVDTFPPLVVRRVMMFPIRWLADSLMPIGYKVAAAHPGAERFGDRTVVFYPPVDTEAFRPRQDTERPLRKELGISDEAPVVGVIGNVNPQKGHEHFVDAAAIVHQMMPEAKFIITGHIYPNHRRYYEALLTRAKDKGLTPGEDIFFIGSRQDIPDVLASIDVFALASVPNSEGTPTVILEAMSCGLPVVATDVGSVSEVVADGETGYVVPSLQPEKMAARLIELLSDATQCRKLGDAARDRVLEHFSIEKCVEAHLKAFDMAIQHNRQRKLRRLLPF